MLQPLTPHAATSRRRDWRDLAEYLAYRYGVGFLLGAIVLVLAAGLIWLPALVGRDLRQAAEQQLQGRVTEVHYVLVEKRNAPMLSTFAVSGQVFIVNRWPDPISLLPEIPVRVGDSVRVTYREGKSGQRYVDRLELLQRVEPVRSGKSGF